MSREYIQQAELADAREGSLYGFKAPDESEWFFPPWDTKTLSFITNADVYSSFLHTPANNARILDDQFIYSPTHFLQMLGSQWAVFRKNVRKFDARHLGRWVYQPVDSKGLDQSIEELLIDWCGDKEMYDTETLINYAYYGENRWGLFYNDKLIGMNIFDENYRFINYRYCIDNGEPFLNEWVRFLFYTSPIVLSKNKEVNDGGSLDSENLRKFKLKLNPCRVENVYSYQKE
jgi:hypothetical protein